MNTNSDNFQKRIQEVETKLDQIIERNQKVELDKAWETSTVRKVSIVLITYILMTLVFYIIKVSDPHINAIIPTLGYFLSTQSLPIIKRNWINKNLNK